MGRWNDIARRGRNVSGPVAEVAALESVDNQAEFLRAVLKRVLLSPIARFSVNLSGDYAVFRGLDVFLSPNPGVFTILGGETMPASIFLRLVVDRTLLLNTDPNQGYAEIREELVGDPGDAGLMTPIPPEYLVYEEARIFGFSFEGSPELRWLEVILQLHSGVLRYLRELDEQASQAKAALERAERAITERRETFPWQRVVGTLVNLLLPGLGFAFLGDVLNAVTWALAVPLLAAACWYLLGQGVLLPLLVWLTCGLVAALHTYRHWKEGHQALERPMAVVLVVFLLAAILDRFMMGSQVAAYTNSLWGGMILQLPTWEGQLLYGSHPTQYLVSVVLFTLVAAGLAGKIAYDYRREARYGSA